MVIEPKGTKSFKATRTLASLVEQASKQYGTTKSQFRTLEIHSSNLHMHSYGKSGKVTLKTNPSNQETLLKIPRWDLDWQRDFVLKQAKTFQIGDDLNKMELEVECEFTNPGNKPIYGGFGSDDEMCFNFVYLSLTPESAPLAQKTMP